MERPWYNYTTQRELTALGRDNVMYAKIKNLERRMDESEETIDSLSLTRLLVVRVRRRWRWLWGTT
ncbi:MAG: hypothetical protein V3U11_10010 [Planctomycetota bacterium]